MQSCSMSQKCLAPRGRLTSKQLRTALQEGATVTVDDYLADFSGEFHDLRDGDFAEVLDPESYVQSQALAERLVEAGALAVVYPSVRRAGGTCLACFRPALVMNVRKGATYRLRWGGGPIPEIDLLGPEAAGR